MKAAPKISEEEVRTIIAMHRKGASNADIARELRRGDTTVRRVLADHGIRIPVGAPKRRSDGFEESREETERQSSIRSTNDFLADLHAHHKAACGELTIRSVSPRYVPVQSRDTSGMGSPAGMCAETIGQ